MIVRRPHQDLAFSEANLKRGTMTLIERQISKVGDQIGKDGWTRFEKRGEFELKRRRFQWRGVEKTENFRRSHWWKRGWSHQVESQGTQGMVKIESR